MKDVYLFHTPPLSSSLAPLSFFRHAAHCAPQGNLRVTFTAKFAICCQVDL